MIFHFLVLQCTTNGANLPFNLLVSNLHALGSILNPILTTFKWLDFWLILADFPLTVLKYSTKPRESVFIFEFSIVELVCMRSFSTSFCGANEISCAARCGGGCAAECSTNSSFTTTQYYRLNTVLTILNEATENLQLRQSSRLFQRWRSVVSAFSV